MLVTTQLFSETCRSRPLSAMHVTVKLWCAIFGSAWITRCDMPQATSHVNSLGNWRQVYSGARIIRTKCSRIFVRIIHASESMGKLCELSGMCECATVKLSCYSVTRPTAGGGDDFWFVHTNCSMIRYVRYVRITLIVSIETCKEVTSTSFNLIPHTSTST